MTLDEAIRHCEEVADRLRQGCDEVAKGCEADHRQLAEWLRELKERREQFADVSKKDTISRQAAICAIEEYADRLQMADWKANPGIPYKAHTLNWCINTLRDLPSIQPKRGKWIVAETAYEDVVAKCSVCGFETLVNEPGNGLHNVDDLHFCPSCGADMRGGNE